MERRMFENEKENEKENFINLLVKNLNSNGFPAKRVAFDIEKIYEIADKFGLSFNSLESDLTQKNICYQITTEKIVFSELASTTGPNENMFAQAQEMLSKMSPEEIQNIQKMYENMSDAEKEQVLKQAQQMGLR